MSSAFSGIIKGGFQLSFARATVLAVDMLQIFVLAKVLGPSGYGEVSLFNLILLYGALTGLGFDAIAFREIPGHVVKNDDKSLHFIKNFSFTVEIMVRVCVGIILLSVGLIFYSGTLRIGIFIIAIILILQKITTFYQLFGNALKKFSIISKAIIIQGFFAGLVTIMLVKWCGVYTRLLAILIVQIFLLYFFYKNIPLRAIFTFRKDKFYPILKMGIPFVLLNIVFYLWRLSDRTLIANMLDFRMLGIYSFAAASIQTLLIFSNDFNTVLQPFLYERTSKIKQKDDFFALVRKPTIFYAYLIPVFLPIIWIGYPYVINVILPNYIESVWPFRILLMQIYLGNIALGVILFISSAEVNKQFLLAMSYVIAGVVSYILIFYFLQHGYGLSWVAIGIVTAQCAAIIIIFCIAQPFYIESGGKALKYYTLILIPVIYLGFFLYILEKFFSGHSLTNLLLQLFFCILFSLPLFFVVNRELNFFSEVRWLLSSKFGRKSHPI